MEIINGRGINCENEVYFDYVDGEIVMTMYRDMAGVRMDRRDPNVIKSFSIDQWEEINGYLRETLDDVEGVYDGNGVDKMANEISLIHSERIDSSRGAELPVMEDGEPMFPGKGLPAMTRSELEEDKEENGEKNDEGNSETETSS